jgi:membrane protease YdiL (CAAX protease family)
VLYAIMFLLAAAAAIGSGGRLRGLNDFLKRLGFDRIRLGRELAIATAFVGVLFLATIVVNSIAFSWGMQEDLGKVSETVRQVDVGEILVVIVTASIVEEIFFRGFLQRRIGIWAATFIFAYFHIIYGSFFEVLGAFVLGLILAKEYQITRNLFTPALSHLAYNLIVVAMTFA